MSTVVNNAYKFNGTPSELFRIVREYKQKWIEWKTKDLTERVIDEYLEFKVTGKASFYCPEELWKTDGGDVTLNYNTLESLMRDQTKKDFNRFWDIFDLSSCIIIFIEDDNVCYITYLDSEAPDLIEDESLYRDYHYQNRSDPWYEFEDFSDEEKEHWEKDYKERKEFWDSMFGGNLATPVEAGLISELSSSYLIGKMSRDIYQEFRKFKEIEKNGKATVS